MNSKRRFAVCTVAFSILVLVTQLSSGYLLELLAIGIVFGLFAASVDLSWGYCGILNLGSAFYFGVGCYSMAYSLKHQWGMLAGVSLGLLIVCVIAIAIGFIGLRSKTTYIQFGLVGLAISLITRQLAIAFYEVLGGSNGITNVEKPVLSFGLVSVSLQDTTKYFVFVCLSAVVGLYALHWIVSSHFGRILICVRDDAEKAESFGYDSFRAKLYASIITASGSSIAGALYAPISGIAHPELFGVTANMLVLVWVAIGGQGTVFGPFICAIALKIIEAELGSNFENIYILVVGLLFIIIVVRLPSGVFGYLQRHHKATNRFRGRNA